MFPSVQMQNPVGLQEGEWKALARVLLELDRVEVVT